MAAQAVGQAVPAGPVPIRAKNRAKQRLHATWPHQYPRGMRFKLAPVQISNARCKEIVAHNGFERGIAVCHRRALPGQVLDQLSVITFNRNTCF